MTANVVRARAQEIDDNKNVIAGGTSMEVVIFTTTVSNMGGNSFSEIPKAVMFDTRTGASDVEFVFGTSTVPQTASGGFITIRAGQPLTLDIANSGPFYFRCSAANISAVVVGTALL